MDLNRLKYRKMKEGFVYILTNMERTKLYIGVTSNLKRRISEHKELIWGHTALHRLTILVYYEEIFGMMKCIKREKQLKNWHKDWKWNLIKSMNPELKDLYYTL